MEISPEQMTGGKVSMLLEIAFVLALAVIGAGVVAQTFKTTKARVRAFASVMTLIVSFMSIIFATFHMLAWLPEEANTFDDFFIAVLFLGMILGTTATYMFGAMKLTERLWNKANEADNETPELEEWERKAREIFG